MPVARVNAIRVAVVDDDENICRSFSRLLDASGMQAITYLSAEAFLDDPSHRGFDCLVFDVHLPGMSGLELQQQLDAAGLATPVLFITAYDDPSSRNQAYAAGCAGYFRKTDARKTVLDAIHKAVLR